MRFKTNINCENCIRSVTPHLNGQDEIQMWRVDIVHPDKILEVTGEGDLETAVQEAMNKSGFTAEKLPAE